MKHCLFTFPKFNINFHLSGIQNLQRQHTSMWSFVHLLTGRNHEATYDCHRNTAIEHVNFPQLSFFFFFFLSDRTTPRKEIFCKDQPRQSWLERANNL